MSDRHEAAALAPVRYRRRLSSVSFSKGLADGWAFGVPAAFKACLDIVPDERLLTPRGSLRGSLLRRGVACCDQAMAGSRAHLDDLQASMLAAGIEVHAFRMAPDVQGTLRGCFLIDLEGAPPDLQFGLGHVFHDPPEAHGLQWGDALLLLRRSITIKDAFAGRITLEVLNYEAGKIIKQSEIELSGADFVQFLKSGIFAPGP